MSFFDDIMPVLGGIAGIAIAGPFDIPLALGGGLGFLGGSSISSAKQASKNRDAALKASKTAADAAVKVAQTQATAATDIAKTQAAATTTESDELKTLTELLAIKIIKDQGAVPVNQLQYGYPTDTTAAQPNMALIAGAAVLAFLILRR